MENVTLKCENPSHLDVAREYILNVAKTCEILSFCVEKPHFPNYLSPSLVIKMLQAISFIHQGRLFLYKHGFPLATEEIQKIPELNDLLESIRVEELDDLPSSFGIQLEPEQLKRNSFPFQKTAVNKDMRVLTTYSLNYVAEEYPRLLRETTALIKGFSTYLRDHPNSNVPYWVSAYLSIREINETPMSPSAISEYKVDWIASLNDEKRSRKTNKDKKKTEDREQPPPSKRSRSNERLDNSRNERDDVRPWAVEKTPYRYKRDRMDDVLQMLTQLNRRSVEYQDRVTQELKELKEKVNLEFDKVNEKLHRFEGQQTKLEALPLMHELHANKLDTLSANRSTDAHTAQRIENTISKAHDSIEKIMRKMDNEVRNTSYIAETVRRLGEDRHRGCSPSAPPSGGTTYYYTAPPAAPNPYVP